MRTPRRALVLAGVLATAACADGGGHLTSPGNLSMDLSAAPCSFTVTGTTMQLDGDCTTSTSIVIPDGFTLDGGHHTITAVDPGPALPFKGGVLRNGGATAYVTAVDIRGEGLSSSCKAGNDRLRGILFDGASGSITHSSVVGVNQGASGCQEGNAIEVRNIDASPETSVVTIAHNTIAGYQKTGIVCNGDAHCSIEHNDVGASATQANLAANSIQFGFGANGEISSNHIDGNSWCGPSNYVATAVLLLSAGPDVLVVSNQIAGNSDVGIYAGTDGAVIEKNSVSDVGTDCNVYGYDFGIGDWGSSYPASSNTLSKNKVAGFDTPFDPENPDGKNKVRGNPSSAG